MTRLGQVRATRSGLFTSSSRCRDKQQRTPIGKALAVPLATLMQCAVDVWARTVLREWRVFMAMAEENIGPRRSGARSRWNFLVRARALALTYMRACVCTSAAAASASAAMAAVASESSQ